MVFATWYPPWHTEKNYLLLLLHEEYLKLVPKIFSVIFVVSFFARFVVQAGFPDDDVYHVGGLCWPVYNGSAVLDK